MHPGPKPFRWPLTAVVAAVCLAAAPFRDALPTAGPPADEPPPGDRPTAARFADLARTDPAAALEAALARTRAECRGFAAVLHKRERVRGKLGPPEVVRVACREEPLAVRMTWEKGPTGFTDPKEVVYARGENRATPDAPARTAARSNIGVVVNVDPDGALSRSSARYSLADFGFAGNTLRTLRAWKAARDAGRLKVEYLGVQPVPECGGRACHVFVRTCDPPEVDNFSLADRGVRDPAKFPAEAQASVRLMLDAETWLQVGSRATHADGGVVGEYFFRDVAVNPPFPADQFRLK